MRQVRKRGVEPLAQSCFLGLSNGSSAHVSQMQRVDDFLYLRQFLRRRGAAIRGPHLISLVIEGIMARRERNAAAGPPIDDGVGEDRCWSRCHSEGHGMLLPASTSAAASANISALKRVS